MPWVVLYASNHHGISACRFKASAYISRGFTPKVLDHKFAEGQVRSVPPIVASTMNSSTSSFSSSSSYSSENDSGASRGGSPSRHHLRQNCVDQDENDGRLEDPIVQNIAIFCPSSHKKRWGCGVRRWSMPTWKVSFFNLYYAMQWPCGFSYPCYNTQLGTTTPENCRWLIIWFSVDCIVLGSPCPCDDCTIVLIGYLGQVSCLKGTWLGI